METYQVKGNTTEEQAKDLLDEVVRKGKPRNGRIDGVEMVVWPDDSFEQVLKSLRKRKGEAQ